MDANYHVIPAITPIFPIHYTIIQIGNDHLLDIAGGKHETKPGSLPRKPVMLNI